MSDIQNMSNSNPLTPTFTPFKSGCGMCKPSTDYYSVKTGGSNYSNDGLIPVSNGQNYFKVPNFNKSMNGNFVKNNYGVDYSTSFGGKSKNKKSKKGGFYEVNSEVSSEEGLYNKVINVNNIQSPGSKTGGKKLMKGGMESSGATPLPLRFFDPNVQLDNYPEISGNNIMTSYGQIESGDIGTGMLAPYTSSSCNSANHLTNMKTGGKKTKTTKVKTTKVKTTKSKKIIKDKKCKKKLKGGEFASINSEEFPSDTYALYESYNNQSGGKKSMKGGNEYANVSSEESPSHTLHESPSHKYALYESPGHKYALHESYSNNKSGGKRSMKGGMESSGATSMDQRFYNPSIKVDNYNELAGNGIMSAYGPIESGNIGTGMLAPYTSSTCNSVNQNTGMKTGGSKSNKSLKGGKSGPIPNISDVPVTSVQNTVGSAISGFTDFMKKLDEDYLKSVSYVKTIKIGNQRLIQGGKKVEKKLKKVEKDSTKVEKKSKKVEKDSTKVEKKSKKVEKEPTKIEKKPKKVEKKSTKMMKKKGGGNGSDFSLTLNSRGPVNAPDDYWGVPGDQWFKQFNKTGEYIPNSKLAYAATPLLAGVGNNDEVSGYDSLGTDYGSA